MKKGSKKKGANKREPERRDIRFDELESILERTKQTALNDTEHETLKAALGTLAFLTQELEKKGASIKRLRKLIFGATTEKTSTVLGKGTSGDDASKATSSDEEGKSASGSEGSTTSKEPEKGRKGHGRNGADTYEGAEKTTVSHDSLNRGDRCPECRRGKVYPLEPAVLVRVVGMAPLSATVYELERLRCNLCGEIFKAKAPEGVGTAKYDETAAAMIGLLRYGCGFPFNRLERLEGSLGIPLPASTQWDIEAGAAELLAPAFEELVRQAAQGELLHNDDTTMRILGLEKPKEQTAGIPAKGKKKKKKRTQVYTSGIVSVGGGYRIALFFTGLNHAGDNLADVLAKREEQLKAPLQMCDALSHNTAGDFETIVANCLAHGRRHFVDVVDNFPDEVGFVLEILRKVYQVDSDAKKAALTDDERLRLHQDKSAALMKKLKKWLDTQIEKKKVEPNSSLGKAIEYMRKHWDALTRFLHVPGAPLDNNIAERALKKAILHRKASMFYKTPKGARVGDLFMSLIHTCELNGANPFDYLVALQRHHEIVAKSPSQWMPWNFREDLVRATDAPPV